MPTDSLLQALWGGRRDKIDQATCRALPLSAVKCQRNSCPHSNDVDDQKEKTEEVPTGLKKLPNYHDNFTVVDKPLGPLNAYLLQLYNTLSTHNAERSHMTHTKIDRCTCTLLFLKPGTVASVREVL